METYKLMGDGYIQRQSDLALIPPNLKNNDYGKYLEDVANGAEVSDFDWVAENERQAKSSADIAIKKEKEALIQTKSRELAELALKKEGQLDSSGKLVKQVEK